MLVNSSRYQETVGCPCPVVGSGDGPFVSHLLLESEPEMDFGGVVSKEGHNLRLYKSESPLLCEASEFGLVEYTSGRKCSY